MSQIHSTLPVDAPQFSLRFRLLMSYHDLTLRDIAHHTDNAISTVGTWKNGRVPASSDTHERLAELFGVSVEFLLYGVGESGKIPRKGGAGHVFRDIEALLGEIDGDTDAHEPPQSFQQPVRQGAEEEGTPFRRSRIEGYLRQFLDRAEAQPGGLAHTWYHLKREFPLDLFTRLS